MPQTSMAYSQALPPRSTAQATTSCRATPADGSSTRARCPQMPVAARGIGTTYATATTSSPAIRQWRARRLTSTSTWLRCACSVPCSTTQRFVNTVTCHGMIATSAPATPRSSTRAVTHATTCLARSLRTCSSPYSGCQRRHRQRKDASTRTPLASSSRASASTMAHT